MGERKGEREGEKEPPTMKPPPPLCSQNPNILVSGIQAHVRLVLVLGGFWRGRGGIETGFLSVAQASLWHEVLLQALSSPSSTVGSSEYKQGFSSWAPSPWNQSPLGNWWG